MTVWNQPHKWDLHWRHTEDKQMTKLNWSDEVSCKNLMWSVKRSVRLLSDVRVSSYIQNGTDAVHMATNSLSSCFAVLQQRRNYIGIFDILVEKYWLGLSLIGLMICRLYNQIDTAFNRDRITQVCTWKTVSWEGSWKYSSWTSKQREKGHVLILNLWRIRGSQDTNTPEVAVCCICSIN